MNSDPRPSPFSIHCFPPGVVEFEGVADTHLIRLVALAFKCRGMNVEGCGPGCAGDEGSLQIIEITTAKIARFQEPEGPISIGPETGPRFAQSDSLRAFCRSLVRLASAESGVASAPPGDIL